VHRYPSRLAGRPSLVNALQETDLFGGAKNEGTSPVAGPVADLLSYYLLSRDRRMLKKHARCAATFDDRGRAAPSSLSIILLKQKYLLACNHIDSANFFLHQ
jgi:hypothetical protein